MLACVPDQPTMSLHDIACVLRDDGHRDAYLNLLRYIELADILADQHVALQRAAELPRYDHAHTSLHG